MSRDRDDSLKGRGVRTFLKINKFFGGFSGLVLVIAWFLVLVNITCRKLRIPAIGLIEIVEYSLLLITFLGSAFLLKEDGHVKMDLLIDHLDEKYRIIIKVATHFLALAAFLILASVAALTAWEDYKTGYYVVSALNFPRAILHAIVSIGSLLISLQLAVNIRDYLKGR